MKRYLITSLLVPSLLFGVANSSSAFAYEPDTRQIKHTFIGPGGENWNNLNQQQLDFLKNNAKSLEFQGATCKVTSLKGCKVFKSENPTISVGDFIQIKVASQQSHAVTTAAFQASCSWCGYLITAIEIVAFVVAAPTMTPAWMIYSTYFIGSSIIFGNL